MEELQLKLCLKLHEMNEQMSECMDGWVDQCVSE